MSKPTQSNKNEDLKDPWALPQTGDTTTTTGSSSSSSSSNPISTLPPGKIEYSCFIPAGAGAVLGAGGGALLNIFGKQPAMVGAFAGAATMATVSTVSCLLIKQRDGSIYDPSWDRTIAYAAGGAVWPIAGEIFRTITKMPVLHPKVAVQRSFTCAVAGAVFGGALDYFNIARPSKPDASKPAGK